MAGFTSKKNSNKHLPDQFHRRNVKSLTDKMRLLQEEIKEMEYEREEEAIGYEKEVLVFACKEAEWRKERRWLKEEVRKLRKLVEEREDKIRRMENGAVVAAEKSNKGWPLLGTIVLLEQMMEERSRRDEAVEKWKRLYLTIRTELDDLIQRTHGDAVYWKAEEQDTKEELKKEVKKKEEAIETLETRIASMEKKEFERERQIDILKQSLRILGIKKKAGFTANSKTTTLARLL